MGIKGRRSQRGFPELWEAVKSERVCATLTPLGRQKLQEKADRYGLSRSEFVERLVRLPEDAFDAFFPETL